MQRLAFTMVELIFVIVIIGILASMAIPKLGGVTDNAKKSAEIATISALSTAIESANGEWSINEGSFSWGIGQDENNLNSHGYPNTLSRNGGGVFSAILKGDNSKFINQHNTSGTLNNVDYNITIFTGPASSPTNGADFDNDATNSDIPNKPDKNDYWVYASLIDSGSCSLNGVEFFSGDILLIDMPNKTTTDYTTITFTNCTS